MLPPLVTNNLQAVVKRLNDLANLINGISGDSKTIRVSKAGGIMISAIKGASQGSAAQSDYSGPWAVVQKDSATVAVKARDTANGYYSYSYVVAGNNRYTLPADVDLAITISGVVAAHVTVSGSTYSVAIQNLSALPANSAGHYYEELASVCVSSGSITVLNQTLNGQLYVKGLIV